MKYRNGSLDLTATKNKNVIMRGKPGLLACSEFLLPLISLFRLLARSLADSVPAQEYS